MSAPICCEVCGAIQWSRMPRAAQIRASVQRRGEATSREIADEVGISIANASNILSQLVRLGVLRIVRREPLQAGGVESIYAPATARSDR